MIIKHFALLILIAMVGCTTNVQSATPLSSEAVSQKTECPVCAVNGDLACMEVTVSDSTPRVAYHGKTFYFCSDDCKKEFLENPELYIQ